MENDYAILLVDSDEAFATMLRESLEENGEYHVTVTADGNEALRMVTDTKFDLAVVDLGLTDPDGAAVARTLRQQQADLRLVLIPLLKEELPSQLTDLNVQGVLPKPFFLPELPARIADALAQSVGQSPGEDTVTPEQADRDPGTRRATGTPLSTAPEGKHIPEEHIPRIVHSMSTLAQEIHADAVILTCGGKLIAHTGTLSNDEAGGLARAVDESWQTSARVAQILGQEQLRFEQSFEGGEHMLYSLAVAEAIILSVALRANAPLGMIRHRTKATAESLQTLIGASV